MGNNNTADIFKENVAKVQDEALRNLLLENFNLVNRERGEFGQKLIEKDTELAGLNKDKQTYTRAVDILKKTGVGTDEIPKILERLQISKTKEEEYELTKAAAEDLRKDKEKLLKQVHRFEAEKVLKERFEKARAEFKDDKGNSIKIANSFVNYDKLFDVQDLANESVLTEKVKLVLNEAVARQTEVLNDVGHVGIQVHKTPAGSQGGAAEGLPGLKDIGEIMKTQGPEAAIAADRARRAKQKA